MQKSWIDNRIRYEFRSTLKLLLHFSISLIQLTNALAILALQILLIITQTCVYHIGVGFWSIPFLLLSPISIWIVIWRRSSISCSLALITHLLASLFATSIMLISFLTLIGRIECSTSSLTMYYIPLNSSFIGIAGLFKIFNYWEFILLWKLRRNTDQIPTVFTEELYGIHTPFFFHSPSSSTRSSWSITSNETQSDLDDLFV